mgnify:CR=1 FL=1
MSRKPVPAQSGERSRVELTFDKPQLLAQLFGQYDQNLVALEHRLGIYITARGNRVGLVSILAENMEPSRAIVKTAFPGVFVVPAGPETPNPSALLSSDAGRAYLLLDAAFGDLA